MNRRGAIFVLALALAVGCENPQEKARYVKEPFESVDPNDLASVSAAEREAKIRLASVRSDTLRAELDAGIDQDYERLVAHIREVEREKAAAERERIAAAEREAERQRELERELAREKEREAERLRKDEERRAEVNSEHERHRKAVADLEVGVRPSLLDDGTKVLVLRNGNSFPVDFDLRCYRQGATKYTTLFVTVPARGRKDIGFLQGWCGNFRPGEHCEAYYEGERVWSRRISDE